MTNAEATERLNLTKEITSLRQALAHAQSERLADHNELVAKVAAWCERVRELEVRAKNDTLRIWALEAAKVGGTR